MNRDVIKLIAMITMFCNHFAHVFLIPGSLMHECLIDTGYFTAITMCFFLVEGYGYTRSKVKYAQRLFLFGCLSQIPYSLALKTGNLNMMFTLFICFLLICVLENVNDPAERRILALLLVFCTSFADWAWLAAIFTWLFVWSKDDRKKTMMSYAVSVVLFGTTNLISCVPYYSVPESLMHTVMSCVGLIASGIVILYFYNGKCAVEKGRYKKWFFYIFYPGHLMLLWLINLLWV
ncbi:TraX family protein [Faecalicatena contorta]|uniref:TraX family protein n=1 Tax=Faecalicatena contorta TaxID=39482 RepID=UPI001F1925D8|nr:TraX family protein [Faecalicatena contorta]MCF2681395.1 hypothetical protein [Faecalicatena contorta]